MARIVRDDDIRSGEPRLEGTRLTVLDIKRRVVDGDEDPFAVAAEYDISVAAVFSALAYYYDHATEMREREAAEDRRRRRGRRASTRLRRRFETHQPPGSS